MNFLQVLQQVSAAFDAVGLRYAAIGGFAMALRGAQRATADLDFLLMLEDLEEAHGILHAMGFRRRFHSDNVSHYLADDRRLGRIDLIHAFRGPSLGMLGRAERMRIAQRIEVPVLITEDIIGLKIQAAVNDPSRATADWADIQMLIAAAARADTPLDWDLVTDYLDLFGLVGRLPELRNWYGTAE